MEAFIADVFKRYGWIGFGVAIFLYLLINLLTNSSFTSLLTKLIERFSKPIDTSPMTEKKKFHLLKLMRPTDKSRRTVAIVYNSILLIFFFYAYNYFITHNSDNNAKVAANIGIFFSAFSLFTIWIKNKSTTLVTLEGNSDDLFRTYQMLLFDMNMTILSFDSHKKEIIAYLNGNELTIKIERLTDTQNRVTFTCIRDFFGIVFYSKEYRRNLKKLINEVSYPEYN